MRSWFVTWQGPDNFYGPEAWRYRAVWTRCFALKIMGVHFLCVDNCSTKFALPSRQFVRNRSVLRSYQTSATKWFPSSPALLRHPPRTELLFHCNLLHIRRTYWFTGAQRLWKLLIDSLFSTYFLFVVCCLKYVCAHVATTSGISLYVLSAPWLSGIIIMITGFQD